MSEDWDFVMDFIQKNHEDSYQNRYPGFVSERLITYFFESRRDKYNLVYCNKNLLN